MAYRAYKNLTKEQLVELWREAEILRAANAPTVVFMDTPTMDQTDFRLYDDSGNEATSVALAATNTDYDADLTGGDLNLQIRMVIKETAGNANDNYSVSLQSSHNSGSFRTLTTGTTPDNIQNLGSLTDGSDTTQRIGSGTFVTPNNGQADTSSQAGGNSCDFVGNDEVEFVWGVRLIAASLSDGDTLDYQLAVIDAETGANQPRITITKDAPITGTGAATSPAQTAAGSGTIARDATGAAVSPAQTADGSGFISRDATGAATSPAQTASGVGERVVTGSGAATSPSQIASGSGTAGPAGITGTGAAASAAQTASGTGEITKTGAGAAVSPAQVASGSGIIIKTGIGGAVSPAQIASGAGVVLEFITGIGGVVSPAQIASGIGERVITGIGGAISAAQIASGAAIRIVTGIGGAVSPAQIASGDDLPIPTVPFLRLLTDQGMAGQGVLTDAGVVSLGEMLDTEIDLALVTLQGMVSSGLMDDEGVVSSGQLCDILATRSLITDQGMASSGFITDTGVVSEGAMVG